MFGQHHPHLGHHHHHHHHHHDPHHPPFPAYQVHRYSMFGQHLLIINPEPWLVILRELNAHALLHQLLSFSDHPNTVLRHSEPFKFYWRRYGMVAA